MTSPAPSPREAPEGELEALRHRVTELEERILEASRSQRRGEVVPERFVDPVIESEARHRVLLAALPDPVVTIEDDGEIVSASDAVRTVLGYRPEDLLGRNVSLLVPEPNGSRHDEYLSAYRETGEGAIIGATTEVEARHRDGRLVPCELSVGRVDIPGRPRPLFTGTLRDVSMRRAAEESLRRQEQLLRDIFDQEYQMVGLLKADGTVVEMNRAALEAVGLQREEVIGMPFWETRWWRPFDDSEQRLKRAVADAAQGEFVRYEIVYKDRLGDERCVDFSLKPICDDAGQVILLLPEGRDVSELKRAQRAETSLLRALASIGESAAVLAHEIKNPITGINVALRAMSHLIGEDDRTILEDLVSRLRRVERMITRTLSFAKPIELVPAPCDAEELFRKVLDDVRLDLTARGIEAQVLVEPRAVLFQADGPLLEEVLSNLVRNAMDALGGPGRIELAASYSDGRGVHLRVDDGGPGILPSVRDDLFKPFVTTKEEGTGIGLAVSKRVVEEHGGMLSATESHLGGASFALELPQPQSPND
ncbi:MAG: PAS domain S-box protein [Planctomycetota bacterium]|nr:PAS domain S-box protein [Planctomycetota bacterium]MDP6837324.1 PAS domain S-box protein [Planctomycetota bacterium]MDP6954460.1 PAS domain S-box protein [Planctomycetota bacterium]